MQRRNFLWKVLGLLFLSGVASAALNRTYPKSATTVLRVETYIDGIRTIYLSTWTIPVRAWTSLYKESASIFPIDYVPINVLKSKWSVENSTYILKISTYSLQEFIDLVVFETKMTVLNEVMDKDMEQYIVWPGTSPPKGWLGWCQKIINGRPVPVPCE